jgi:hypothetical protein
MHVTTKQNNMSNKTATATAKAIVIKANDYNVETFAYLQKQFDAKADDMYKINLAQGEIGKIARDMFKLSEESKVTKIADFIEKTYKKTPSYFYRLIKAFEVSDEIRRKYEAQETEQKTISKLLSFAKSGDETETDETEPKVKAKTFKATAKDGKIVVEGDAPESELCAIVAEINKLIEAKRKARSESKAA